MRSRGQFSISDRAPPERWLGRAIAVATLLVLHPDPGSGQALPVDVVVPDEVSCASCTISVRRVLTFGGRDGPDLVVGYPIVADVDPQGRYWLLADTGPQWDLRLYDRDGSGLGPLARQGSGPGELRYVTGIVAVGDSMYVIDMGNGRVTVYDPDLVYVRDFPLHHDAAFPVYLGGGQIVVNGRMQTPERVGLPLHLFTTDGEPVRAFGSVTGEYRSDLPHLMFRKITPSRRRNAVWSAWEYQYVLEEWNISGDLERRIVRDAPWFPPVALPAPTSDDNPPPTGFRALRHDTTGVLWTAVLVAAPDYHRGLGESVRGEGGLTYNLINNVSALYDTVIEAIDPDSGRVIARRRIRAVVLYWLGDGEALAYRQTEDGVPIVDILRVELNGR